VFKLGIFHFFWDSAESRIYLSAAGLQTLHISILLTGAEYPYFGCSRHITMGSIAAKIHMPSMQFPNQNSRTLCCIVICLFETVGGVFIWALNTWVKAFSNMDIDYAITNFGCRFFAKIVFMDIFLFRDSLVENDDNE
jgi:hypothetical protein